MVRQRVHRLDVAPQGSRIERRNAAMLVLHCVVRTGALGEPPLDAGQIALARGLAEGPRLLRVRLLRRHALLHLAPFATRALRDARLDVARAAAAPF